MYKKHLFEIHVSISTQLYHLKWSYLELTMALFRSVDYVIEDKNISLECPWMHVPIWCLIIMSHLSIHSYFLVEIR